MLPFCTPSWSRRPHGIKFSFHVLLDLRGSIPTIIEITDGSVHDVNILDHITIEPGAIYIMDRGYLDLDRLYSIHCKGAFFITRAKGNTAVKRVYSRPVDKTTGLRCDQSVRFTVYKSKKEYPELIRRIKFLDPETGNTYVFLTNNFELDALLITQLYKERWKIELFFKWIKQHLHVKTFYGTSMNAVFTQIWIAICDYLLLIIARKRFMLEPSLHTISNSIGQILFKRGNIRDIFNQPTLCVNAPEAELVDQLSLW